MDRSNIGGGRNRRTVGLEMGGMKLRRSVINEVPRREAPVDSPIESEADGVAQVVGGGRRRMAGRDGGRQRACRKAKSAPIAVLGSRGGRGAL